MPAKKAAKNPKLNPELLLGGKVIPADRRSTCRRLDISVARSMAAAAMLTIPSPDTAPRTKLFVSATRTSGTVDAK